MYETDTKACMTGMAKFSLVRELMLISCFLSQSCMLAGVPEKQKTCYPIKTQEGQAIKELSVPGRVPVWTACKLERQ